MSINIALISCRFGSFCSLEEVSSEFFASIAPVSAMLYLLVVDFSWDSSVDPRSPLLFFYQVASEH